MGSPDADRDRVSGTLKHSDSALEYSRAGIFEWRLPFDRIVIVGEFTISSLGDDYFFLFVTPIGECFQASFYALGQEACLAALSERFGSVLEPALCNSTDLKSRVLWPAALLGQPLLEPIITRPAGFLARMAYGLGLHPGNVHLSVPVRTHLGLSIPTHAA